MELLKKIFYLICILALWVFTTTKISEYMLNRPMDSFIQLVISIGILAYTSTTFYFIYKLFNKPKNND